MRAAMIAAILATAAASAAAQPYRGGGGQPTATLYEFPNFQGRQFQVVGQASNLPREFNDVAMSARFQGRWRVCSDSDFGGRCVDLQGDVRDLSPSGMTVKITSLQAYVAGGGGGWDRDDDRGGWDRGGSGGGGWSRGASSRGVEGARTVFFAYPRMNGHDIAARGDAANAFCRTNGLGSAAWFDSGERARESVDGQGRFVGDGPVLRDVVCRKY